MNIQSVPEQLTDTWTRLHRAKENYDSLVHEATHFLYEYIKGMVKGWNPESGGFCLQLRHPSDSSLKGKAKVLVVDIVENLRASLDYMVFELSVLNKPDLKKSEPQFVIADTREEFIHQSKRRLRYLTNEQRTDFVERLQPFCGNFMLALLRDLTNQSKHRQLLSLKDHSGLEIYLDDVKKRDGEEYKDCFVYPMEKDRAIFARANSFDIVLLEEYDALKTLKAMVEHVGDIVRISHSFFEDRPFRMEIIPH